MVKRPLGQIAIAAAAVGFGFTSVQSGPADLRQALQAFEESAERLGSTGSPLERAQAIKALASVASPRYTSARDQWATDSARDVRIAILDAIVRMGDNSYGAKRIVLDSLRSDDPGVVGQAIVAIRHLRLRVEFAGVWSREGALTVWSGYERSTGPPFDQLYGIADVRPWNDPAWNELSPRMRRSLLARAGSREALTLLAKSLDTTDGSGQSWRSHVPAEAVDLQTLRNSLRDPREEIRSFASYSLVAAGSSEHLSRLEHCLIEAQENSESHPDCSEHVLDQQVLRAAIPRLGYDALLALELRDSAKWILEVQRELVRRGSPLSYAELEQRRDGVSSRLGYRAGRPYTDAARARAAHARTIKGLLLSEMVRDRRYEALVPLLSRALMQRHPFQDLRAINNSLAASPDFLANLPHDIAHQGYRRLKGWIGTRTPDNYRPHYDDSGVVEALRTLGTLARGEDYEELWAELQAAGDPLRDLLRLIPVMWNRSHRSQVLRELLADAQRSGWFSGGDNFYDLLERTKPERPRPDLCSERPRVPSWNPFEVPAETPTFRAVARTLASDLDEIYSRDTRALSRDFLEYRGLGERIQEPVDALELLWDPRQPIRVATNHLFEGARPLGRYPPGDRDSPSSRASFARLEARLSGFSLVPAKPVLLAPAADEDQRALLEAWVQAEKVKRFQHLIEMAHKPMRLIISCGARTSTKALVSQPYRGFVNAMPEFAGSVRDLMNSSDAELRHGAAWALLLLFRDESALRVFLEDAHASDVMVRARALHVLETIRHADSAPLFPALLHHSSPALRQVGLWGVRSFRLRSALPEVEDLVLDDDPAVAETAIEVVGSFKSSASRSRLLRLLAGPDRLARKAATALVNYRTTTDIDALVARLVDDSASEQERSLILGVLTDITGRPSRQPRNLASSRRPVEAVQPETVQEWRDWWRAHRSETPGERFMSTVATLVEQFVEGDDQTAARASRSLSNLVPALNLTTSGRRPPEARERESVRHWWRGARGSSPWLVFTNGRAVPEKKLDLAMDIDPQRTRWQLVAPLLRDFPAGAPGYGGSWHKSLVRFAEVDFGDPAAAICETRDEIISNWLAWARNEGWFAFNPMVSLREPLPVVNAAPRSSKVPRSREGPAPGPKTRARSQTVLSVNNDVLRALPPVIASDGCEANSALRRWFPTGMTKRPVRSLIRRRAPRPTPATCRECPTPIARTP